MKIAHLMVVRALTAGQTRQLVAEHAAAQEIGNNRWETVVLTDLPSEAPFVRQTPPLFRGLFRRRLYAWWVARRLSRQKDVVLMRYTGFDPLAFVFAPGIPNRATVHHAKVVEELLLIRRGWRGRAASRLERIVGPFSIRRALAIVGVTQDIAEHENARAGANRPALVFPNGVRAADIVPIADRRADSVINVTFICGVFSPWHGLDRLVAAVRRAGQTDALDGLCIHLIGRLSPEQADEIAADPVLRAVFVLHGHLPRAEYEAILEQTDVGLASFAMDREGLTEGSTLKVRELLGAGIPVYSGHSDAAFGPERRYAMVESEVDIVRLRNFARRMKAVPREAVTEYSARFIDKKQIMLNLLDGLERLL